MKKLFNKTALAMSLTAAMGIVSMPAMAGEGFPKINFTKYNSATAEKWVMDLCPDPKGVPQCENKVVLTTYSDVQKDKAFAKTGFRATKRLHDEGLPVFYVMAQDNNDDPQDAVMRTYVNGKSLTIGYKIEAEYGLLSELALKVKKSEDKMYASGKKAYEENLATPTVALR